MGTIKTPYILRYYLHLVLGEHSKRVLWLPFAKHLFISSSLTWLACLLPLGLDLTPKSSLLLLLVSTSETREGSQLHFFLSSGDKEFSLSNSFSKLHETFRAFLGDEGRTKTFSCFSLFNYPSIRLAPPLLELSIRLHNFLRLIIHLCLDLLFLYLSKN